MNRSSYLLSLIISVIFFYMLCSTVVILKMLFKTSVNVDLEGAMWSQKAHQYRLYSFDLLKKKKMLLPSWNINGIFVDINHWVISLISKPDANDEDFINMQNIWEAVKSVNRNAYVTLNYSWISITFIWCCLSKSSAHSIKPDFVRTTKMKSHS